MLRFVPSSSEGWPEISAVVIYPDRLEFQTAGDWKTFAFDEFARWPRPKWLWKRLRGLGYRLILKVGARDWFNREGEKFFIFYTDPCLKVCLPAEEGVDYSHCLFVRVKVILYKGGYDTFDMG